MPSSDALNSTALPSGSQHEIAWQDQVAVVTEVGAALREYRVGDRDVVMSFGAAEISPAYHGAVLLPWPNRLRDGAYEFAGQTHQLPLNEPSRQVALHGLVSWERWSVTEHTQARVSLRLDTVPLPGYPFGLRVEITYELSDAGLAVTLRTQNVGASPAPYGVGFHPWLSPGGGALDDCLLTVQAATWVRLDERLLPASYETPPAEFDFRAPRRLGATELDHAFVDALFVDGRSWVRLTGTDGRTAAAWTDASMTCWQVCSADGIADPRYQRRGLAAEAMTCIADAFRTGERLITLPPGGEHTVRWGLQLD